jgi:hypothetical protein
VKEKNNLSKKERNKRTIFGVQDVRRVDLSGKDGADKANRTTRRRTDELVAMASEELVLPAGWTADVVMMVVVVMVIGIGMAWGNRAIEQVADTERRQVQLAFRRRRTADRGCL